MSTRTDQLLRRAAGNDRSRPVALTREEKALRAFLEQAEQGHAQPDLSQNDPTAPDYVKGKEEVVFRPDTAEVGQTIVVKSVDENGKPTEWEAVDLPSGGGEEYDLVIKANAISSTCTKDNFTITSGSTDACFGKLVSGELPKAILRFEQYQDGSDVIDAIAEVSLGFDAVSEGGATAKCVAVNDRLYVVCIYLGSANTINFVAATAVGD